MLPQVLVRAADARPYEVQDLLPADSRFKVIIFAGDTGNASQRLLLENVAEKMGKPESFLNKYSRGSGISKVFEILSISSAKKEIVNYTDLPKLFRPHWSK